MKIRQRNLAQLEASRLWATPLPPSPLPSSSNSALNVMQIMPAVGVTLQLTGGILRNVNDFPTGSEFRSGIGKTISSLGAVPHEAGRGGIELAKCVGRDLRLELSRGGGRRRRQESSLLLLKNINQPSLLLKSIHCSGCNLLLLILLTTISLLAAHGISGHQTPLQPATLSQQSLISAGRQLVQQAPQFQLLKLAQANQAQTGTSTLAVQQVPLADDSGSTNLEAPLAMHQPYSHGPALDLVALNQRRFELDHRHLSAGSSDNDVKRGELIESYLANMPDRLMASLPEDMNRQVMETLAADANLMATLRGDNSASLLQSAVDDPDGASIERLTKSCMSVHASSARLEQLNVTFHLFTRSNPLVPFMLRPQVSRLELIRESPFDPKKPIRWVTHGFHTNVDKSEWMIETKDKILAFEDSNVILTDWRRGASPALAFYPKAAANAHVVAKIIVKILRRIRYDIDFSRVHLIGHSLGAHIMGFVGGAFTEEYLYEKQHQLMALSNGSEARRHPFWRETAPQTPSGRQPQLIGRITACDPALPCFGPSSSAPAANSSNELLFGDASDWTPSMWTHLRPDSAVTVEVMHSNPGVMGYSEPLGDFDFYPNGLERQPGCGTSAAQSETRAIGPPPPPGTARRLKRQLFGGLLGNLFGMGGASPVPAPALATARSKEPSRMSSTLDRLIKPIRDFFQGYTCSHHRSVEYMVESMYYERVPPDRRLEPQFVCQMVGYRCQDYASFKRGFCFRCNDSLDCRAFTMSASPTPTTDWGRTPSLAAQYGSSLAPSSTVKNPAAAQQANATSATGQQQPAKRVLPTFNQHRQNYLPQMKNQYFFDTRASKDYCVHHYHLFVKYRWFRVRSSVTIDGFHITGTNSNLTYQREATFNRFTYHSYTMLFTEPVYLGQIESLILLGDGLMSNLIDYIEVSYLSNLDPQVRAISSARLCRQDDRPGGSTGPVSQLLEFASTVRLPSLFTRCPGGARVV